MADAKDSRRIVITGAAGGIGTMTRPLLARLYPGLVLSDRVEPAELQPGETFVAADLTRPDEVAALLAGADSVIHLGGHSVEGTWDQILQANIIGCYNLFEAAREAGVKRMIFASSNHAIGFYPRKKRIGTDVTVRPDSRYGVSKVFGEGLGAAEVPPPDPDVLQGPNQAQGFQMGQGLLAETQYGEAAGAWRGQGDRKGDPRGFLGLAGAGPHGQVQALGRQARAELVLGGGLQEVQRPVEVGLADAIGAGQ